GVERSKVPRFAPSFQILRAEAPNEFRSLAFRGKHPAQKKQIARLHRLCIGAERLRRGRQLDAKFFQLLLGADWPRGLRGLPFALSQLLSSIFLLMNLSRCFRELLKGLHCRLTSHRQNDAELCLAAQHTFI